MPRLPIPGSDEGTWGDILNEFLAVEHNTDGTLKKATDITAAQADATQALSDAADASADLATHAADTTAIHGIADTADLIIEGDSRLTDSRAPSGSAGGVLSGTYPNPGFAADMATQAELDAHVAAADPHTVYQKESEKNAADGYAGLDSSTLVPRALLGTGTLDGTKFLRDDGTWQTVSTSLTPWTSNIDADGNDLLDVAGININSGSALATGRLLNVNLQSLSITDGVSRTFANVGGSGIAVGTSPVSSITQFGSGGSYTSDQTITSLAAGAFSATISGVATTTNLIGVSSAITTGLGNTATTAKAYQSTVTANLANITTGIGLDVNSSAINGGGITDMIGLRVTGLSGGTTKWGMQVGDYQSYHEGDLRVGALTAGSTAAPNSRLEVVEPALGTDVARFTTYAAGAGANPIERVVQQRALTLNATPATLISVTIPSSTTVAIHAYVAARRDNSSSGGTIEDGAFYEIVGTFKNVAGTATQIGITTALVAHESQALWDCTFDVTGATARVRITGAANNSIYWQGTCHIFQSGSA